MVDVLGAVIVITIAFAALFGANSRAMGILKSAKQASVASKCLQQRIEQLRNYNWTQVTDSSALQDLYSSPPLPSIELPGFQEKLTVTAFSPASTSGNQSNGPDLNNAIKITRSAAGLVTQVSDNPNLTVEKTVRIDVQIQWPGPGGAMRTRETSVIIANGGIGR